MEALDLMEIVGPGTASKLGREEVIEKIWVTT